MRDNVSNASIRSSNEQSDRIPIYWYACNGGLAIKATIETSMLETNFFHSFHPLHVQVQYPDEAKMLYWTSSQQTPIEINANICSS